MLRATSSSPRRLTSLLAVGALTATIFSLPAPASAAPLVDSRSATLTSHPAGLPVPGAAAARQLASAKVTQDLVHDRLKATITLRATPTADTSAEVRVEFGKVVGNACEGDVGVSSPTHSGLASGFTRSGRVITLNKVVDRAGYMAWNCAFVVTGEPGTQSYYDAVLGGLTDTLARPKLKISTVQLLRKNVRSVKLVRNAWTVFEVRVANPSRVPATKVTVKGAGAGLRVAKVNLGKVYDDGSALARVRVKLIRKKATTLTLTAAGSGGVKAVRKVRVRSTAAPKRPVAGSYKSKDGRIRFRIKQGRVVNFFTRQWTVCGGYPSAMTSSWAAYDFPRTAVPRNGIVDARQKRSLFTAGLKMRVVGKSVNQGHFFYAGPNRCYASQQFTARRVGK